MIRVIRVEGGADRRDFLDVPARIHAAAGTSGHYVPLLRSDVRQWTTGRGWFPEPITCLLARDEGGQPVGRMILHHSRDLDDTLMRSAEDSALSASDGRAVNAQLFGAFEAQSPVVAEALLEAAEARGRADGRSHVFGPVSPLPNVTGGALTSGFEAPGFFDTAWNPKFVTESMTSRGYSGWGAAHTWEVDIANIPSSLRRPPTPHELDQAGISFVRPRRRPGWLARVLRPTLNASFAALPYYTAIGTGQMRAQTAGAEFLMDRDLVVLAARQEGGSQLASFALVLPDPIDILRAHDGHLGARAGWDLLRASSRRSGPRDAVLIIQGTDPAHQGRGLLSLCIRRLYAKLHSGGYERLRITFVAEENRASAAVFDRAGGRRLHGLSFFVKDLR